MAKELRGGTSLSRRVRWGLVGAALVGLLGPQATAQQPGLFIDTDGKVGIGRQAPIAPLDIGQPTSDNQPLRTGSHPPSVQGLYVTGNFPAGRPGEKEAPGVEFRHHDGSQGIGFGYNTIYAAGTKTDQDLNIEPRGTGKVGVSGPLAVEGAITGLGTVPVGAIMMWSGELTRLPDGWRLCDGQNETPDLRGRFIVGYHPDDADYNGIKAGARPSAQKFIAIPGHNHPVGNKVEVTGRHLHGLTIGKTSNAGASGSAVQYPTDGRTAIHPGDQVDNRPPYYVLAFIQYKGTHTAQR